MAKDDDYECQTNPTSPPLYCWSDGLITTLPGDVRLGQAPASYSIQGQFIVIATLISVALLLLFFILYTFFRHRHTRRTRPPPPLVQYSRRPQLVFSVHAEPCPNRLDQIVINSIPVIQLPLHGHNTTETCAVCISELAHGEKVRVLPQCHHRFHLECIDMWFGSHSTCPLCRSHVNSPAANSDAVFKLPRSIHVEGAAADCSAQPNNCSLFSGSEVHRSPLDQIV